MSRLIELKFKILDIVFYSWYEPLMDVVYRITNIISWIPILWQDKPWSETYILKILQFKLKKVRITLEKDQVYLNSPKYAKQIKVAELLLDRLTGGTDCYTTKDWEEHYKLYPILDIEDWFDSIGHFIQRGPEEHKDVKRIMQKEEYMYKQDLDYLFKYMKKHLTNWSL